MKHPKVGAESTMARSDVVGWLSLRQALLGFVALNPTYNLPMVLPNAKPNKGRFRHQVPDFFLSHNERLQASR
jgi:hypothetical protein